MMSSSWVFLGVACLIASTNAASIPAEGENFIAGGIGSIESVDHLDSFREKRSGRGYGRGQTQSQYLNFGSPEEEGKAEADANESGSRSIVSGSHGMGQAQSQFSFGDCSDCSATQIYEYPTGSPDPLTYIGGSGSLDKSSLIRPGTTVEAQTGSGSGIGTIGTPGTLGRPHSISASRETGRGIAQTGGFTQPGLIGQGQAGFGQHGSGQPGPGQPGPGQPGPGQPGPGQPGPGQPYPGQPGPGQPGPGQPGPGQPGSGRPGPGQPGPGQPGTGQPRPGQSGLGQPGYGQSGYGQPGPGQPGPGQRGLGQPGSAQPGSGQPGPGQVGLGQPGIGHPSPGQIGPGQPLPIGSVGASGGWPSIGGQQVTQFGGGGSPLSVGEQPVSGPQTTQLGVPGNQPSVGGSWGQPSIGAAGSQPSMGGPWSQPSISGPGNQPQGGSQGSQFGGTGSQLSVGGQRGTHLIGAGGQPSHGGPQRTQILGPGSQPSVGGPQGTHIVGHGNQPSIVGPQGVYPPGQGATAGVGSVGGGEIGVGLQQGTYGQPKLSSEQPGGVSTVGATYVVPNGPQMQQGGAPNAISHTGPSSTQSAIYQPTYTSGTIGSQPVPGGGGTFYGPENGVQGQPGGTYILTPQNVAGYSIKQPATPSAGQFRGVYAPDTQTRGTYGSGGIYQPNTSYGSTPGSSGQVAVGTGGQLSGSGGISQTGYAESARQQQGVPGTLIQHPSTGTTPQSGIYRPGVVVPHMRHTEDRTQQRIYEPGIQSGTSQGGLYVPDTSTQQQTVFYGPEQTTGNASPRGIGIRQNVNRQGMETPQGATFIPGAAQQGGSYGTGSGITMQSGSGIGIQQGGTHVGPGTQPGIQVPQIPGGVSQQSGIRTEQISGGGLGTGAQQGTYSQVKGSQNGVYAPGAGTQSGNYIPGTGTQHGAYAPGVGIPQGTYSPGVGNQQGTFGSGIPTQQSSVTNTQQGGYSPGIGLQQGSYGTDSKGIGYVPSTGTQQSAYGPGTFPGQQTGNYYPDTGAQQTGTYSPGSAYNPSVQQGVYTPEIPPQPMGLTPAGFQQAGVGTQPGGRQPEVYRPAGTGAQGGGLHIPSGTSQQFPTYGPGAGSRIEPSSGTQGMSSGGQTGMIYGQQPAQPSGGGQQGLVYSQGSGSFYGQGPQQGVAAQQPSGGLLLPGAGVIGGGVPGGGGVSSSGAAGGYPLEAGGYPSMGGGYAGTSVPQGVVGAGISAPPSNLVGTSGTTGTGSGTDDAFSQAESSINDGQASASAQGKKNGGTAKTQVSGTYSSTGAFSASAMTSDSDRSANAQVSGSSEGAMSQSQGNGGAAQSQAQVQVNSKTGGTKASSQSGGIIHQSQSEVQANDKGGLADSQSSGPGQTSSQAQIGFRPRQDGNEITQSAGGGQASAQSGSYSGQSQSQIQGKSKYGVSYHGAAQSASGTKEQVASYREQNRQLFHSISQFGSSDAVTDRVDTVYSGPALTAESYPLPDLQLKTSKSSKEANSNKLDDDDSPLPEEEDDEEDPYDEYDDEDEYYNEKTIKMDQTPKSSALNSDDGKKDEPYSTYTQNSPTQTQQAALPDSSDKFSLVQNQNGRVQRYPLRTTTETVPSGFRGTVNIEKKFHTKALESHKPDNKVTTEGESEEDDDAKLRTPDSYVTVTKSVTGSMDNSKNPPEENKNFQSTYYTKSSTCGYFTFSCNIVYGANGRSKICRPKAPTNGKC